MLKTLLLTVNLLFCAACLVLIIRLKINEAKELKKLFEVIRSRRKIKYIKREE